MSGMENGSRQAAVNGMDGKGNASVTMETVGRHWRTKTRKEALRRVRESLRTAWTWTERGM